MFEDIEAAGGGLDQPYQVLAQQVTSLNGVSGAFDISVSSADSLPLGPGVDDEMLSAAGWLEDATLIVQPIVGSADFRLEVGLASGTAGTLHCTVAEDGGEFRLTIGLDTNAPATNPKVTRQILDALNVAAQLISVYYDTGHVLSGRSMYRRQARNNPFPGWVFEDFGGYTITDEKPTSGGPSKIDAAIAEDGDTSLFAWVVHHFNDGWLTCDDRAGEVADFVHLAPNGDLSLIYVKAAGKGGRQVSVGPFEEVVTQATKNLRYLDQGTLYETLARPEVIGRASWTKGQRVADRKAFLVQLKNRSARRKKTVVIVQPHVSEAMVQASQPPGVDPAGIDELRLMLLETLLNASASPVTGIGGQLQVIGSLQ